MTNDLENSPSFQVMREAIELAIEERSPYPESSMFIDADSPHLDEETERAAGEGYAVVLVSADGSTEVLLPQAAPPEN